MHKHNAKQQGGIVSQKQGPPLLAMLLLLLLSRFSPVRLFATPWTAAHQAPPSIGFFQARVLEWDAIAFSRK